MAKGGLAIRVDRDSLRVAVLGSGSKGNCYYVASGAEQLLLDAGLTAKQTELRLSMLGIEVRELTGIVITHEHSDHIAGLKVLSTRYHLPVWCNALTGAVISRKIGNGLDLRYFKTGVVFTLGALTIHPFSVYHDACDPVGLLISANTRNFALVEDLGYASNLVIELLKQCHGLCLETNHDVQMLMNGPYPWSVKARINSRTGHLSNEAAAMLLEAIYHRELKYLMLCHLSDRNNDPGLAETTIRKTLDRLGATDITIEVARQDESTRIITV